MRVLLVEDDEPLGKALAAGMKQANHGVEWVTDGESALLAVEADTFDVVVLDINLPRLSGLEVLKQVRGKGCTTPVVVMTARGGLEQRIEGLDLGADDYLVKPFDLQELMARIRAVTRRSQGRADSRIVCRDIVLDTSAHEVRKGDGVVRLTAKEYKVLALLMEQAGKVLGKSEIESMLYGWEEDFESNTVETAIYSLRKKLGHDSIVTIRGVGYMMNA